MANCATATIRTATAADAAGIATVHVETWRDAYAGLIPNEVLLKLSQRDHVAMWSAELARGRETNVVVAADGAGDGVVGFGSCGRARKGDLPYAGEVYTLYVHPDFQEMGIGRRLLEALFRGLLEKGSGSALVWVLAGNPARFFYSAMGGAHVAVRTERLWGTALDELAYGWADLEQAITPSGPCSTVRPSPIRSPPWGRGRPADRRRGS